MFKFNYPLMHALMINDILTFNQLEFFFPDFNNIGFDSDQHLPVLVGCSSRALKEKLEKNSQ